MVVSHRRRLVPPGGQLHRPGARGDGAGNLGYHSRTLTIDRTAPVAPGASGTTGGGMTISFTGEADASFQCLLDVGAWTTCASAKAYSALTVGAHTFAVRAVDGAGNVGTATTAFVIDRIAPTGAGFTTTNASGGTAGQLGINPPPVTYPTGEDRYAPGKRYRPRP